MGCSLTLLWLLASFLRQAEAKEGQEERTLAHRKFLPRPSRRTGACDWQCAKLPGEKPRECDPDGINDCDCISQSCGHPGIVYTKADVSEDVDSRSIGDMVVIPVVVVGAVIVCCCAAIFMRARTTDEDDAVNERKNSRWLETDSVSRIDRPSSHSKLQSKNQVRDDNSQDSRSQCGCRRYLEAGNSPCASHHHAANHSSSSEVASSTHKSASGATCTHGVHIHYVPQSAAPECKVCAEQKRSQSRSQERQTPLPESTHENKKHHDMPSGDKLLAQLLVTPQKGQRAGNDIAAKHESDSKKTVPSESSASSCKPSPRLKIEPRSPRNSRSPKASPRAGRGSRRSPKRSPASSLNSSPRQGGYDVGDLFVSRAQPKRNARGRSPEKAKDSKPPLDDGFSDVSTAAGSKTTISKGTSSAPASTLPLPSLLALPGGPAQAKMVETSEARREASLSVAGQQRLTAMIQRLDAAV